MSAAAPPILICTNGAAASAPAFAFGEWLARTLQSPVRVLGIVEKVSRRSGVESAVDEAAAHLRLAGLEVTTSVVAGSAVDGICAAAGPAEAIAVLGPLGRPRLRRLLRGGTFRDVLACAASPVVYAPVWEPPLRRILVCSGGLAYAADIERLAVDIAGRAGAAICLLHIVEPITLDYPTSREIEANWQNLLETETPQARNLAAAVARAEQAGVEVTVKIRRGNPIHEIAAELRGEEYQLVGMGSPHSARSLRRLFLPNVTAEVAEAAPCPVLAVRAGTPGDPASPATG